MIIDNKNILIVGLGKSGKGIYDFAVTKTDNINFYDDKVEEFLGQKVYSKNTIDEIIEDVDVVVMSPGVPLTVPFIKKYIEAGGNIIGEIELAYKYCAARVSAITGTNGKTTTTSLVGDIFKLQNDKTFVLGNIGKSFSSEVKNIEANDNVILELSSFQLETIREFRPFCSAVLNITPDHLNRHITMDKYVEAKENIFKNQTASDYIVLNYNDEYCKKMANKTNAKVVWFSIDKELENGIYYKNNEIIIKYKNIDAVLCSKKELNIVGEHNIENVMAAAAIALTNDIKIETIRKAVINFKAVEHRIEFVRELEGVKYFNDSKGTNPDASIKAINAMDGGTILIAGGMDKKNEFDEFVKSFKDKIKQLNLIGETKNIIKEEAEKQGFNNIKIFNTFEEAIRGAYEDSKKNNVKNILLSPGCASWDMFESYEKRGNIFKDIVAGL